MSSIVNFDVMAGMQSATFLGNIAKEDYKDQTIKFNSIRKPRAYETDLTDPAKENNWRTSLLFSKESTGELLSIGISSFVNFTVKDGKEDGKMIKILQEKTNDAGQLDLDGLKFEVMDVLELTDNDGHVRYPRNAYKAYNKALKKEKKENADFTRANWDVPETVLNQCTGDKGLVDDAKSLKTLVLKEV